MYNIRFGLCAGPAHNGMNGRDAPNNKRPNKRCLDVRAAWPFQSPFSTQTSIRSDPISNSELNRTSHALIRSTQHRYLTVGSCEELMPVSTPVFQQVRVGCGVLRRAV